MNQKNIGLVLSTFFASALMASTATAEDKAPTTPTSTEPTAEMPRPKHNPYGGEKHCQNNSCGGHSECMGYGNDTCGGANSCKGKGWVMAKTEKECKEKMGIWHGKGHKNGKGHKHDKHQGKKENS